jgi:streptogramin lyase
MVALWRSDWLSWHTPAAGRIARGGSFRPHLEGLEERCVPSEFSFNEFLTPTLASGPRGITAGPDGNVWFTEQTGNHVGRITPAGNFAELALPSPNSGPVGITTGPDGNLWFTEANTGKIGRLTPALVLTEFQVPSTVSGGTSIVPQLTGIAAGGDGNLWFTEFNTGKVGSISTDGNTINQFQIPSSNGALNVTGANEITATPDGNLWFTEQTAGQIGRIIPGATPSITEFALPSSPGSSNLPAGIVSAPDGNVWFAEAGSNKIGKITPNGIVTVFPVPTPASSPRGMAVGTDGNLYFVENNGNRVGQITLTGTFQEFTIPTAGSLPVGLAQGPDGNLWFTEMQTRKIGEFILPHYIVTGAGAGSAPEVKVFDSLTGAKVGDFMAYTPGFLGGVRVAIADVNHDGVPDIITAPGAPGGPEVKVFEGFNASKILLDFMAYNVHLQSGVYVAAGDYNGDGYADIAVGPGQGGGPEVKVFSGKSPFGLVPGVLYDSMVYSPKFFGGVRVAFGDVSATGKQDLLLAPGPGLYTEIQVVQGGTGVKIQDFIAYTQSYTGGAFVSAGDVNGDGHADIIVSLDTGAQPIVSVFDGTDDVGIRAFYAYTPAFAGGVRIAAADLDGDGKADIITGTGPGGGPQTTAFDGLTSTVLDSFYSYDPNSNSGLFVGAR